MNNAVKVGLVVTCLLSGSAMASLYNHPMNGDTQGLHLNSTFVNRTLASPLTFLVNPDTRARGCELNPPLMQYQDNHDMRMGTNFSR